MSRIKLVISDCHLSAGLHFESRKNPHEDFHFDDEMVDFIEYFSNGKYGEGCEVELFINGDFLDFLNVAYRGEFEEVITEQFALYKLECILNGHPKVFTAMKRFASLPGKTISYNVGNHDADLFFPKVRQRIIEAWDPQGKYPSEKVKIYYENPVIDLPGGVQIHHGHQHEAVHVFNYIRPLLEDGLPEPVLNIPWGSFYVLKIVNRLKWERDYVDKVRPIRAMILWGLIFDTWFTMKFMFLSAFYFMKTRFVYSPKRRSRLSVTLNIFKQQLTHLLKNLEAEARELLDTQPDVHTVIMGHTHLPMLKSYPDGKIYVNTGTWTKMIHLDLRGIGNPYRLTFALIEYDDSQPRENEKEVFVDGVRRPRVSLQQWIGEHRPHTRFDD